MDDQEIQYLTSILPQFELYGQWHLWFVKALEQDFSNMKPESQRLLPTFGDKLAQMKESIALNQSFLQLLHTSGKKLLDDSNPETKDERPQEYIMDKLTATLLQIAREWTQEGEKERAQSFSLILESLQGLFPAADRHKVRILVPGCGTGRLVWEITRLGFSVEGNELSWFMLLAMRLILSCGAADVYKIVPYATEAKNQLNAALQNRVLSFPDINPSLLSLGPGGAPLISLSSGDWLHVYDSEHKESWNCVVTSFFVDTASCILEYVERIALILVRGGFWINFGPLSYHYAGQEMAKPSRKTIELTYLELKAALPQYGFELKEEKTRIESQYCQDPHSLKHRFFDAVFFVAVKI